MAKGDWVETYCVVCRGVGEVWGSTRRDLQVSRQKSLVRCERCNGTGRLTVRIPSEQWPAKARIAQRLARVALRRMRKGHRNSHQGMRP